jgi:hypothetical protein
METITVTVSTPGSSINKEVEVPSDFSIELFIEEAKQQFNLFCSCRLVMEETNQLISDRDTFESAGIKSGQRLCLYPKYEVS